ncbi:hypothetical protein [Mucilaginibacter segetis]|uniref:Uncharacterized protein n=1 Tax=Mucilaginibacter segetis TaxID=2793071 RepID=A0A934PU00_9SPHI|nr:hypothetical protein [Mucilaginibacter segetis]MBK0380809.1 hypothetical protein [Mucilaginibacter segetis]
MANIPNNEPPVAQQLKTITIIHIALTVGQVLFALISIFTTEKIYINVTDTHDPFIYIVPVFAVGSIIVSNILYHKKISNVVQVSTLSDKLAAYQTALIVRYAPLEAASLFSIVSFMLTGILFLLVVTSLMIVYFIYLKPSAENIKAALHPDYTQQDLFKNSDNNIF